MIPGRQAAFVFILSDCLHALLLAAVRAQGRGWELGAVLGYTLGLTKTHAHKHADK